MKKLLMSALAFGALMVAPAIAQAAAQGFATANVNMRSGPSTAYPAVTVVPVGAPVTINGCMSSVNWCDVSFVGGRGWVSGSYVQTSYRSNRVYVAPDYYEGLGIPSVTFEVDNYWDRYYRGRDFYRERDRWRRYDWHGDRQPPPPPRWDRDRNPPPPPPGWDRNRDGRDRWDRNRDRDGWDRNRDRDGRDRWDRDRDDRRPPPRGDRGDDRRPQPDRGNDRRPPPQADRGDDRRPPPRADRNEDRRPRADRNDAPPRAERNEPRRPPQAYQEPGRPQPCRPGVCGDN